MSDLVDVIEVEFAAPYRVRVLATGKTEENAEAFIRMAVARRGVEHHFYKAVEAGRYADGDVL